MKIRNFVPILRMYIRQAFFHKKAAIATVLSWSLRVGVTIILYSGIYGLIGANAVKGITFDIAASSMMLYAVFCGFGAREIFRQINTEFKSGAIEIWLNKPAAYLPMKMAQSFGKELPSALALVLCTALFWLVRGLPEGDHAFLRILCGILLLFMGILIGYMIYALIGMMVIWMEDASPLFALVDKTVMVFGGIYIPIGFFPAGFRLFGESLPMGATNYVSQIFYPDFFQNLPRFLITQVLWLIILFYTLRRISQRASSRLSVNGG